MSKVLVLRTCNENHASYNGFRWPEVGPVACDDWLPSAKCGNGLHGLLWGEGDATLLDWSPKAIWKVVAVEDAEMVSLGGKVKFPRGVVLFSGSRFDATSFLAANGGAGRAIAGVYLTGGHGSVLTGGHGSVLTGGRGSTLTGGCDSVLTGGRGSTLTGGHGSVLTGADYSVLTGGCGSVLTGEHGSVLTAQFWDSRASRRRLVTAYIGENGILPGVAYRLNDARQFEADKKGGG